MCSKELKTKTKKCGWIKYVIFNLLLLGAVFACGVAKGETVEAVTENEYVLHQTNHKGNNSANSYTAVNVGSGYYDKWYVQGKAVSMKDVVTLTLKMPYLKGVNGLVVYEQDNTGSATSGRKMDSYKKDYGEWVSLTDAAETLLQGKVLTSCTDFATQIANSTDLKANGGSVYSILCITEEPNDTEGATDPGTITIQYAYTIRNGGYGRKTINFTIYNDSGYDYTTGGDILQDPMKAKSATVTFVVAKPISENSFTWVSSDSVACATNTSNSNSSPQTDNVCITYKNAAVGGNEAKYMSFTLPKETAYIHKAGEGFVGYENGLLDIDSIKDNTIYGTNTFTNTGSDENKKVVYYYWDFKLADGLVNDATTGKPTPNGSGNTQMDPSKQYFIALSVDASGQYAFYITDIFGNIFNNESSKVGVNDVLITNIIIDYTNAVALNIMTSTGSYDSNDWKQTWTFAISSPYSVDFSKMVADEITVELYVFQKILISNGVFAGNGTDSGTVDSNIEDIAKQPLTHDSGTVGGGYGSTPNFFTSGNVSIWRVADVASDSKETSNAVSCGTAESECVIGTPTFTADTNVVSGKNNKITFVIKNNGRYRIQIKDSHNNTTQTLSGEQKNPKVEVSVIDRTTPVITSDLSESKTSIYSYPYVIGGGQNTLSDGTLTSPIVPSEDIVNAANSEYWKTASNYKTIYYNASGTKIFTYQDALEIAKIKVVDEVEYYFKSSTANEGSVKVSYTDYQVRFGYDQKACFDVTTGSESKTDAAKAGIYCDPTYNVVSDRDGGSGQFDFDTSGFNNLHEYIIARNFTSFSGGLVKQVGYTDYNAEATNLSDYIKIDDAYSVNRGVDFVNGDGTGENNTKEFLGYLKIKFQTQDSAPKDICEVSIGAGAATINYECFKMMNQYIDDVENFQMKFTAVDYKGHESAEYIVKVNIIDNTSAGIDMTGLDAANSIEYSNEETICRLEIDNLIQEKNDILNCYKLYDGSNIYKFKDNNVDHAASYAEDDGQKTLSAGKQYYVSGSAGDKYDDKIKLYVQEENNWMYITGEDTDENFPRLYKSGYHKLKIEIRDHKVWDLGESKTENNLLTIYVTYYVNPRTLLIEPLANEKMYGEAEPTLDYCVYVNKSNHTFNLEDRFFDSDFINTYFTYIYCSRDVYAEIKTGTDGNLYTATSATKEAALGGYNYLQFTKDTTSTSVTNDHYVKVNNTYVKVVTGMTGNTYSKSYTEDANGNFYMHSDSKVYEIKSGYLYEDAECTLAHMGTGNKYFKVAGACVNIDTEANKQNRLSEQYGHTTSGAYIKYNMNAVNSDGKVTISAEQSVINEKASTALVNGNKFQGKLARVESRCYNKFSDNYYSNTKATNFSTLVSCDENATDASKGVRNDNVGQYHIVLGTISIKEDTDTKYNDDYVIKINTNYVAEKLSIKDENQTITKKETEGKVLVDDGLKTESTVNFTIRQAVLTITANGSTKDYGEQDPYSNNWNKVDSATNSKATGYLGGYSVHGWRYDGNATDNEDLVNYIIQGTLRREVGEEVGIYDICNIAGNPSSISYSACLANVGMPETYDTSTPYNFNEYDHYADGGVPKTDVIPALSIRENGYIYITDSNKTDVYEKYAGRTLNRTNRNYVIVFIKADFKIEATDVVIQPGINQGKEYAKDEYKDPLWQLVVYGEAISNVSGSWSSNIVKAEGEAFSGYTATINVESNRSEPVLGTDPYDKNTNNVAESEVYYSRRKLAPSDAIYQYTDEISLGSGTKRYSKSADEKFYYEDENGTYIYAYGRYYLISDADKVASGTKLKVTVTGRLVNQTYSLFTPEFKLERTSGKDVGWYAYNEIKNFKTNVYTLKAVTQRNGKTEETSKQCIITETSVVTGSSADAVRCRNYNVVYKNTPPTYESSTKTYTTSAVLDAPVYKPNGINQCNTDFYSYSCSSSTGVTTTEISFEIFKREIILEFIDDNYTFIYGERYDYYDGGTYNGTGGTYIYNDSDGTAGKIDGIFNIKNNTSEGDIFLCYSDLGDYLVDCTTNNDYGITAGDSWTSIGLKFYLHSDISAHDSGYYTTGSNYAVPAGTYYVYADIGQRTGPNAETENNTIKQNYKFTYKGGTLTIKPKVTNVQLTGYTMEYGETMYSSYGVGSNYTDYTSYKLNQCMTDASYLSGGTDLITFESVCVSSENIVGNMYGFVIEGLDNKDTIAANFTGRPVRASGTTNNGQHPDVGYYKISVGSIKTIQHQNIVGTGVTKFAKCETNLANGIIDPTKTDCVFVNGGTNGEFTNAIARNYDITYSLDNNEGAHLFILPATLEITVYQNQTKMYGCAYSVFQTDANEYFKNYTYTNGYANCDTTTDYEYDFAYKYKVEGDKDLKKTNNIDTYDVSMGVNGDNTYTRLFTSGGTTINYTTPILSDYRLYRVTESADTSVDYKNIKTYEGASKYQGQAVDVYTITLGNLNVVENSNGMCDAYNNPVLEGGIACRNYNINYYGNSATSDIDTHKYTDKIEINLSDLSLYTLNYSKDAAGTYVLINGKYVHLNVLDKYNDDNTLNTTGNGTKVLVNKYVAISSLAKYKKLADYEESATCASEGGCYIYLKDSTIKEGETQIATGYVELSKLDAYRYTDATGTTPAADGAYLKVTTSGGNVRYIKLDSITKFKKNTAQYEEVQPGDSDYSLGKYVLINDSYVLLSSLRKYTQTLDSDDNPTGIFTLDSNGTYVQIYEFIKISDLDRYKLNITNSTTGKNTMYSSVESGDVNKNLYAFVNGSYVPYNSLITNSTQSKIDANSANTATGSTAGGNAYNVKFTIVARIVYVHPEYNVKPYGVNDPVEYITCDEIKTAYGLSNFTGRNEYYCGTDTSKNADNNATKIDLGVSMYYAVQNSLATAPWTVWSDDRNNDGANDYTSYNDIQYDVLTGKVSRKFDPTAQGNADANHKSDKAGKYTYDFADVNTNDGLSGNNYMIQYVTSKKLEETYVKTSVDNEFKTLDTLLFTECSYGDANCVPTGASKTDDTAARKGKKLIVSDGKIYIIPATNGKYIDSGTSTSISLVQKYSATNDNSQISYWYLGFYKADTADGRSGELAKWWSDRTPFIEEYDAFRAQSESKSAATPPEYFHSGAREVYFEIIKRTIYLYAVDVEKTYGEADKYSDFLVAICPNADGYIRNGDTITCASVEASSFAHGLSPGDETIFKDSSTGAMKQWQIKNDATEAANSDYMFKGEANLQTSFGIYFRRANGENAGSYTITACATQTGVSDCTHKLDEEQPNYTISYVGDNYEIIEIPGVLTIKTREINVTPDTGQGFQYGNNTENGSMPNITFTEARKDKTGENGLVYGSGTYLFAGSGDPIKINKDGTTSLYKFAINSANYIIDGRVVLNEDKEVVARINVTQENGANKKQVTIGSTTYDIIQKASCLINISGIYTVCISDAQNESLINTLGDDYYEYYTLVGAANNVYNGINLNAKVYDGSKGNSDAEREVVISNNTVEYYSYSVFDDDYSDSYKAYTRVEKEANGDLVSRFALNLKCGETSDLRYSREVCNYNIVSGELKAGEKRIQKTTEFYIYLTPSRLYKLNGNVYEKVSEENADTATHAKYGTDLYAPISDANLVSYVCENVTVDSKTSLKCEYKKDTNNNYLKVTGIDATSYNYNIAAVDESKTFNITAAGIKVTPKEKQYKIYGEADIEIKFDVETTYVVSRTHYQNYANSNIVKICKNGDEDCFYKTPTTGQTGLGAYLYNAIGDTATSSDNPNYILLTKGWTITLDSYAYDEEVEADKTNDLDYGINRAKNKHDKNGAAVAAVVINQSTTGLYHYDKYTKYNTNIDTNRILIGNLYVKNYVQSVGEKEIINGLKVGNNSLGNVNYSLSYVNTNLPFVIVPRPVNVEIENIEKIYGQATDVESFDNNYTSDKIVGEGILIEDGDGANEDTNESKLINNYNILDKKLLSTTDNSSDMKSATIDTATYTGLTIEYMSSDADYTKMNMPTATSKNPDSGSYYSGKVSVTTSEDAKYFYTTTEKSDVEVNKVGALSIKEGLQERKNATLNIKVTRSGNYNIARNSGKCLVDDGMLCEDVGEYYLQFAVRNTKGTVESTVTNAYFNRYWGYNNNYYVVIYNNFVDSNWTESTETNYKKVKANDNIYYNSVIGGEGTFSADNETTNVGTYNANADPLPTATLKIRKRSIQIVTETISEYEYIKEADLTGGEKGTHLKVEDKYYLITETNTYTRKEVDGKWVYTHSKYDATKPDGTYYLCDYAKTNKGVDCAAITSASRFKLKSKTVGEKYAIEQDMDVPSLVTPIGLDASGNYEKKDVHHSTYGYITWYDHPLQVRTKDYLTGKVAYCQTTLSLGTEMSLDDMRREACSDTELLHYYDENINKKGDTNFFETSDDGFYIITRETDKLFITNPGRRAVGYVISDEGAPEEKMTDSTYEANNYTTDFVNGILQIDLDETAPIINVNHDSIIKETNEYSKMVDETEVDGGNMSKDSFDNKTNVLDFLTKLRELGNKCANLTSTRSEDANGDSIPSECVGAVFTREDGTNKNATGAEKPTVSFEDIKMLMEWFGISSFDPSIMRAGVPVTKEERYEPRWYMAIQSDFNQTKAGNYTLFIYAQDNAGNISLATTVTLRLVDTTKPTVGTINLYNAKVKCKPGTNCSVEDNWVVAENVYLPINSLTSDNLSYLGTEVTSKKYYFVGNELSGGILTPKFEENNIFGTYYLIPAETNAKAVKHTGWTNTRTGIYMTITGGDDNSLTYLDTSIYTEKYSITGNDDSVITIKTTDATHLLLGSFINVGNMTKYRSLGLDASGNEVATGAVKTVYIPDKSGTIIRYKGYYYNLSTLQYMSGSPSIDEYKVKLYYRTPEGTTYNKITELEDFPSEGTEYTLYLRDGDLYQIPGEKYDANANHSSSGTYINFAQWDHYYSRDGGASWIKYSRDTTEGKLVLGEDGQRLIMIKAVDNGYTYEEGTFDKYHITDAYCHVIESAGEERVRTCSEWQHVTVTEKEDLIDYIGDKVWQYNVSDWATDKESGTDRYRDRKYAYLDTIIPNVKLKDQHIEVFQYGCSSVEYCSSNHVELFGTAVDGYLFKLDELYKFTAAGVLDKNGTYVRVNNELIEIEDIRRFNLAADGTITQSDSGAYIYLGKTDTVADVDVKPIEWINSIADIAKTESQFVYDDITETFVSITIKTALNENKEKADNLQENTKRQESGVGLGSGSLFDGEGNVDKTFGVTVDETNVKGEGTAADIADKYTTILVYTDIIGGAEGAKVENHPYFQEQGLYKSIIMKPEGETNYKIYTCYFDGIETNTGVWDRAWCASPTVSSSEFTNIKAAMEDLMAVYKKTSESNLANAYNFNGNEITFTIDYRVYDIAGNASTYERKGVLLTGFTTTIGVTDGSGEAVSSLAVEVGQNTNVASILSNFKVVSTTGSGLKDDEHILQSVYYNGVLISSKAAYDLSTLSQIDTTVPGVYTIVYNTERKDGLVYVQGNSVELTITVKPDVAIVSNNNITYSSIVIGIGAILLVSLAAWFIELKKRIKNN